MPKELTIGDYFTYLAGDDWKSEENENGGIVSPFFNWPPDVFALCASVLRRSGGYLRVMEQWPPPRLYLQNCDTWQNYITFLAYYWVTGIVTADELFIFQARQHWDRVLEHLDTPLSELTPKGSASEVAESLICLCCAADEASRYLGLVGDPGDHPLADIVNWLFLEHGSVYGEVTTLCQNVHPSRQRVLPKIHTPQRGICFRGLTHYLALCPENEVSPMWHGLPSKFAGPELAEREKLNLLLLPWPLKTSPDQFKENEHARKRLRHMPDTHSFFSFEQRDSEEVPKLETILAQVGVDLAAKGEELDCVILPELSLTSLQVLEVLEVLRRFFPNAALVTGTGEGSGPFSSNKVCLYPKAANQGFEYIQNKQHRWMINRGQVKQYKLEGQLTLPPDDQPKYFWEDISVVDRCVRFAPLALNFTFCCLVCEDLARQEPSAELIRSIGPDLVIAILMDAPQMPTRWPGRHAGVISEDPGGSVLSLTNFGMMELSALRTPALDELLTYAAESHEQFEQCASLSCDPDEKVERFREAISRRVKAAEELGEAKRTIALWTSQNSKPNEIDLPAGADGMLLSLKFSRVGTNNVEPEFTLDGRGCGTKHAWQYDSCTPVRIS